MAKIIGIPAEYNPFHKGHLHQIKELRRKYSDAVIVTAISAAFVQRGTPALLDKHTRAEMAVRCGVDLAVELPVPFSCHCAGVFAGAVMTLLKACGCDAVSFGMEDEAYLLREISYILVQESPAFKAQLHSFLKKGFSYAQSQALAADALCPGAKDLLEKPNNSLAVAYAESALRLGANFEFLPVRRLGAGHHDETASLAVMSASGIRAALAAGQTQTAFSAMPEESADVLRRRIKAGRCLLDESELWRAVRLLLLRSTPEKLCKYAGISEGIEHRLFAALPRSDSFEQFVENVSTRRYPRSRVRRLLIWLLLDISKEEDADFQARGPAYLRPLAMSARGRNLLKRIREQTNLPIVSKPAALGSDRYARSIFRLGLRAAALRESFLPSPDWKRELSAVPFQLPAASTL